MQQCSVPPAAETQHGQGCIAQAFFCSQNFGKLNFPAWEAEMAKKALNVPLPHSVSQVFPSPKRVPTRPSDSYFYGFHGQPNRRMEMQPTIGTEPRKFLRKWL